MKRVKKDWVREGIEEIPYTHGRQRLLLQILLTQTPKRYPGFPAGKEEDGEIDGRVQSTHDSSSSLSESLHIGSGRCEKTGKTIEEDTVDTLHQTPPPLHSSQSERRVHLSTRNDVSH